MLRWKHKQEIEFKINKLDFDTDFMIKNKVLEV